MKDLRWLGLLLSLGVLGVLARWTIAAGIPVWFLVRSCAAVLLLPWLVGLLAASPAENIAALRTGLGGPGDPGRAEVLLSRLASTTLAAGVLVALLTELAGLSEIAATGGQGNPAELLAHLGRMAVPVAFALALRATLYDPLARSLERPATGC